ncbi:MAG: hypothetical protein K2W82_07300 [Candidatus Obscuribacterales bacterium]|nr:hypothetical protein [Candidatus Obscuribacterales bacterium]
MSSLEKHAASAPPEAKDSSWAADNAGALWSGQEKGLAKLASNLETRDNDPQATLDAGLSNTADLYNTGSVSNDRKGNAAVSDDEWAKRAAMTPSQRLENELDQQPTAVEIEKVTPKVIQADLQKPSESDSDTKSTKSTKSGFRAMGVRILPPPNRPEAPKANTI